MYIQRLARVGLLAIAMQLSGCGDPVISFSSDIQPIFDGYCIECHSGSGEGVAASGFSVQDYESVMKGTDFGQVVVPGSSMSSVLYLVAAGKTAPEIQMPPQHPEALAEGRGTPLSKEQIAIIQTWIDQGAIDN